MPVCLIGASVPAVSPEHLAKKHDSIHPPRRQLSIVATNWAKSLPRFSTPVLRLVLPRVKWLLRSPGHGPRPKQHVSLLPPLGADHRETRNGQGTDRACGLAATEEHGNGLVRGCVAKGVQPPSSAFSPPSPKSLLVYMRSSDRSFKLGNKRPTPGRGLLKETCSAPLTWPPTNL